ncbi:MAG: hypothetical protein N3B15_01855 [Planctomycetota bacterium]|nr:hypothetical protein [Planctomycetota bacterium]
MLRALAALLALLGAAPAGEATLGRVRVGPNPRAVAFFEERIRPVLVEHCYQCHGGGRRYGGLAVDRYESLLAGGWDEGPAVIPGDPVNSALLRAMRWEGDSDLNMPPNYRLPETVIRDFERWVEIGAPWPDEAADIVAPASPPPRPPWLGRLHPALVHFPIAFLALACLLQALVIGGGARWQPAVMLASALGAGSALLAALSGQLLASDQDPTLLARHQLAGWITVGGALLASLWALALPGRRWALLGVLLATALAVALAGHSGGALVWGPDWLAP